MSLQAQDAIQLSSFSEELVLETLDVGLSETGNLSFLSVSVTTIPPFLSDGVVPLPANVVITDTSTPTQLSVELSGDYGVAIAIDDFYRTVTYFNASFLFTEYNNFNTLEQDNYSHLIDYLPQDWSYKTYVYSFSVTKNGSTSTVTITQDVYPNTNRHVPRVVSLISKEITV